MFSRFGNKKNATSASTASQESATSLPSSVVKASSAAVSTAPVSGGAYEDVPFLQIGDEAPDFTADSQVGTISLHGLIDGAWGLLVFFSKDFDPVHTTEMGYLSKLKAEFDSRQVKVIAVSPDTKLAHQKWVTDVQELQDVKVTFPLVSDDRADVCKLYGLLRPKDYSRVFRPNARVVLPTASLFVVDLDRRIRLVHHYSPSMGRNFYEIIRAIDALQTSFFHQVCTPCNWMQTEDVFINTDITSDAAHMLFPKGFMEIKPWFRLTPQPDIEEK